jgi:hypothetical protein
MHFIVENLCMRNDERMLLKTFSFLCGRYLIHIAPSHGKHAQFRNV